MRTLRTTNHERMAMRQHHYHQTRGMSLETAALINEGYDLDQSAEERHAAKVAKLAPLPTREEWIADRCELLLPSVPLAIAAPYMRVLLDHAESPTDATRAALLSMVLPVERMTADEATTIGDLLESSPIDGYLAPSGTDGVKVGPAIDAGTARKLPNGTVRGHRDAFVINSYAIGTPIDEPSSLTSRECLQRADMWALAAGVELEPLIGTDEYNWSQIIDPKPVTVRGVTMFGDPVVVFAERHHMGASVTAEAKRKRPYKARRATYAKTAEIRAFHVTTAGEATLRSGFRTTFDGRYVIGFGAWHTIPVKGATTRTGRKATRVTRQGALPVIDATEACTRGRETLEHAFKSAMPATLAMTYGDTRVTVAHKPDARQFTVTVTTGDKGSRKQAKRNARTVATAVSALKALTR